MYQTPVPLGSQRWPVGTQPLVTVFSWIYNHAPYVSQSIESILQQETTFPVEIILQDDASTDGTTQIIRDFESRLPWLFNNRIHSENYYSRGMCVVLPMLTVPAGEFVALSHGDDYWTSPHKLQRQVELLLRNPQAPGCFTAADDVDELSGNLRPGFWRPPGAKPEYHLADLFQNGNFTTTASVMYRRSALPSADTDMTKVSHADFVLLMHALIRGPMLYIDEVMSAYRRHAGGIHTSTYGVIANTRAIQALVEGARMFHCEDRAGYIESFRWRVGECLSAYAAVKHENEALRAQLVKTSTDYDRFRSSGAIRLMIRLQRCQAACYKLLQRLLMQKN